MMSFLCVGFTPISFLFDLSIVSPRLYLFLNSREKYTNMERDSHFEGKIVKYPSVSLSYTLSENEMLNSI